MDKEQFRELLLRQKLDGKPRIDRNTIIRFMNTEIDRGDIAMDVEFVRLCNEVLVTASDR
ncbi:hypothetical protein FACS1894202_07430 [Clostridia bacterium]|nr:hypothetical protein FACS1894202_07430 [Clostridia bacterium]